MRQIFWWRSAGYKNLSDCQEKFFRRLQMAAQEAKIELLACTKSKDSLEAEADAIASELRAPGGGGIKDPLTDAEGGSRCCEDKQLSQSYDCPRVSVGPHSVHAKTDLWRCREQRSIASDKAPMSKSPREKTSREKNAAVFLSLEPHICANR